MSDEIAEIAEHFTRSWYGDITKLARAYQEQSARAAQAEAENAVIVGALEMAASALEKNYADHGINWQTARSRAKAALNHTTEGARRLLDVVEAARRCHHEMRHQRADSHSFTDALEALDAALSRHGNPEDPK